MPVSALPGQRPVTAQTRPPEPPGLARAKMRRGAGLDVLVVLYAEHDRGRSMTTRQVADQTQHRVEVVGSALGRGRALGLVERTHIGVDPRLRVWRITVAGCDFLRETAGGIRP